MPLTPYVSIPGIPDPPFGIAEDVEMYLNPTYTYDYGSGPEPYRTANGLPYTYYVDSSAPGATDTGNPHGSPALPRLTWPYPLIAGDCVQIHGSGYTFSNAPSNSQAIGGTGTEANPIFFYGIAGSEPILRGRLGAIKVYGDWTIIEHVHFSDGTTVCSLACRPVLKGAPVLNVCIRDCVATGTGVAEGSSFLATGGAGESSAEFYTENVVVLRCTVSEYGDWEAVVENDKCGVIAADYSTNIWILDCEMFHLGGDSVRIGVDQGGTPSGGYYYIGRCEFYENHENAVDVKQALNAVISSCVMWGFYVEAALAIHYGPENIWFVNNIIHSSLRGAGCSGVGTTCYFVGNVVYDCEEYGLYLDRGGGAFTLHNNTIDGCGGGIVSTGTVDSFDLLNNVVTNITDPAGFHLHIENTTVAAASTAANMLFYQGGSAIDIHWAGVNYTTVGAWQTGSGKGANSLTADPLYRVDGSYRVDVGSPTTGAGAASAINATFEGLFDASIDTDYYGNARPTDGTWDIGAFEFVEPDYIFNITTLNATTLTVG